MSISEILLQYAPFSDNIASLLYGLTKIPRPFLQTQESEMRATEDGIFICHKTKNETITYERRF